MAKLRREGVAWTPYDRPILAPPSAATRSPGWLAEFIIPATRKIAGGTGKIISTVFSAEGSSSSEEEDISSDPSYGNDGSRKYAHKGSLLDGHW